MISINISVLPLPVTPCNKWELNFLVSKDLLSLFITIFWSRLKRIFFSAGLNDKSSILYSFPCLTSIINLFFSRDWQIETGLEQIFFNDDTFNNVGDAFLMCLYTLYCMGAFFFKSSITIPFSNSTYLAYQFNWGE